MTKDENRRIDERATLILRERLSGTAWQVYDLSPDISKDHRVELVEKGTYLGTDFIVQLKGQKGVRLARDGEHVKYRIETKYLKYYETVRSPVFLVVVDVTAGVGYWLFVQKYLREELRDGRWRSLSSVVVYLPVRSTLDAQSDLRAAAKDAELYMAAIHPQVAPKAVQIQRTELEALDPRFRVKATATETGTNFWLQPRTGNVQVEFRLSKQDQAAHEEFRRMLSQGGEIRFERGQLSAGGSPLLEHVAADSVSFKWGLSKSGSVILRSAPRSGPPKVIATAEASLEGGLDQITVRASLDSMVLAISCTLVRATPDPQCRFSFGLRPWIGKPIRLLSGIGNLAKIASTIASGDNLAIEWVFAGHDPLSVTVPNGGLRPLEAINDLVRLVTMARELAEKHNVDPVWPEKLADSQIDDLEVLYQLSTRGVYSERTHSAVLTTKIGADTVRTLPLEKLKQGELGRFSTPLPAGAFDLLGVPVSLGPLAMEITDLRMTNIPKLERQIATGRELLKVTWDTTKTSITTYRVQQHHGHATITGSR